MYGYKSIVMSSTENLKISLQDILLATNKFAEANIIARGGFGNVYRGRSEQHGILAIKRLDRVHGQGDREFGVEIQLLSIYKHENLVSLVGFCEEGGEKILVYKYETNGSLDKFLHKKDLTWERRLQIRLDAARGLRYLHDEIGSQHRVIHRDIKSANILLDENWKAKISDFGLSKIALANVPISFIYSAPCGTYGYVDPEFLHGSLTQKSDVYSFGVVLFEVLFGKLVTVPHNLDDPYFTVEMAQNHYQNKTLDMIIDPDLRNQMTLPSLRTFSTIAYQCLKNRRDERPTMSSVVEELHKALGHPQVINLRRHKASTGFSYDVYITRSIHTHRLSQSFYTPLCVGLEKEGLSIYQKSVVRDVSESESLKAIEQSRSFIIFLTLYSAHDELYCDEIVKIIECMKEKRLVVIPVVCNLSLPELNLSFPELREQRGIFWERVSIHNSHSRIQVWRNALVTAINLPGFTHPNNAENIPRMIAKRIKAHVPEQIEESQN